MSNFLDTIQKFRKLQLKQDEAQNLLNAERGIEIEIRPETYLKQNNKIILLEGFQPLEYKDEAHDSTRYHFIFIIQNLSDDLMIMLRPTGIFYGTSAIGSGISEIADLNFIASKDAYFLYVWERVDDENYKLHVHISLRNAGFVGVQVFFDLFLYNYSFATYTEIL